MNPMKALSSAEYCTNLFHKMIVKCICQQDITKEEYLRMFELELKRYFRKTKFDMSFKTVIPYGVISIMTFYQYGYDIVNKLSEGNDLDHKLIARDISNSLDKIRIIINILERRNII